MCLLIVGFAAIEPWPLIVAANRDERLDRPAVPITVLRASSPRILGGRDELSGGSWLAVNEFGVVAAVTNWHTTSAPDPRRRSRGELPLLAAQCRSAKSALGLVFDAITAGMYNPALLIVADRDAAYYVEIPFDGSPHYRKLDPGVRVLGNRPLGAPCLKVERARRTLDELPALPNKPELIKTLTATLAEHGRSQDTSRPGRWLAGINDAACVHGVSHGTRSATIALVPREPDAPISMLVADGKPCTTPFVDYTEEWRRRGGEPGNNSFALPSHL